MQPGLVLLKALDGESMDTFSAVLEQDRFEDKKKAAVLPVAGERNIMVQIPTGLSLSLEQPPASASNILEP